MPGLIRGVARVAAVAGTATAVSNRVSRRQGNRWAHQADEEAAQQAPAAQAPAASGSADYDSKLAQLRQLGQLHDQGVLDDAEFEMQKSRVLNS